MGTFSIRSFAAGEISPALYARVEMVKYATGLKTCRNWIVLKHGGVSNRPGFKFIGEVKDSTKNVRLMDFVFNTDQTYILEFGDEYMRVIRNGAYVTDTSSTITGITKANPAVVTTSLAHGLTTGNEVTLSGVLGMTQVNGRNYTVTVLSGTTFSLQTLTGTNINSTSYGTFVASGTPLASRIYTNILSPYDHTDLADIQYVQSGDVITLTHPEYPVYDLARTGHTTWTFTAATFTPSTTRPTGGNVTSITAGANTYRYRVTAVAAETFEESLPGFETSLSIVSIAGNPAVVTTAVNAYVDGDQVYISGVTGSGGVTALNGNTYTINQLTTTTFELNGVNGTGFVYTGSGTVARTSIVAISAAAPTASDPHTIGWNAVTGAVEYNIYKEENGIYGFIGTANGTGTTVSYNDIGVSIDTEDTPPSERNPFSGTGNYPSCVTYYQQRKFFANTDNDPEKIWASRIGQFSNFSVSSPIQDDDSLTFVIAGRRVNEVRQLIDVGQRSQEQRLASGP